MDESLHDERLTAYIDGVMSDADKKAFERELEGDTALRQKLEDRRLAIEAVRQAGTVRTVKALHTEMMAELRPSPGTIVQMRRWSRKGLSMAASIIFLIMAAGAFFVFSLTPGKLYDDAFVDIDLSGSRGAGEVSTAVSEHYRLKQYSAITNERPANLTQQDSLLVGLSYLHTGEYATAAQWFASIRHPHNPYREDGDFYLALARLREKKYDAAMQLLSAIRSHENHLYYHQVSPALIRKIGVLEWKE